MSVYRYGRLPKEEPGLRNSGHGNQRFVDPVIERYGRQVRKAGGEWDGAWMGYIEKTAETVRTAIRNDFDFRERLKDFPLPAFH